MNSPFQKDHGYQKDAGQRNGQFGRFHASCLQHRPLHLAEQRELRKYFKAKPFPNDLIPDEVRASMPLELPEAVAEIGD